jgi:flavin reductase (DIM6/NTAB) family NADH-FMN oxidoreductase RutF/DNA-binding IclR family transcriptional regulator
MGQEPTLIAMSEPDATTFDSKRFREVLGAYPTGVTVVTAMAADQTPVGMAVGSFTSVSLDPPLVAFFPEKTSTTFPKIRETGAFCVNVLGAAQERTCRSFATRGIDKFDGIGWSAAGSGSPLLDDVIAWIDCDIESVTDVGDHHIVIGRVRALDTVSTTAPLVFYRGGYGRFSSSSLVAAYEPDLAEVLRYASLARDEMEAIATDLDLECTAAARVGSDLVVIASAGGRHPNGGPPMVGRRIPMAPPIGAQYLAWEPESVVNRWLSESATPLSKADVERYRRVLARVRERGWLLYTADSGFPHVDELAQQGFREGRTPASDLRLREAIGELPIGFDAPEISAEHEYRIRRIISPILNAHGEVILTLNVLGPDRDCSFAELVRMRDRLQAGTAFLGELIHEALH